MLVQALAREKLEHARHAARGRAAIIPPGSRRISKRRSAAGLAREMAALNEGAALDLRANALKGTDREQARVALLREGVEAARTPLSPLGLRVFERIPLGDARVPSAAASSRCRTRARSSRRCWPMRGRGCASSISAPAPAARPWRWRPRWAIAAISSPATSRPARLERATQRLRRAGASIVQRVPLSGERDKWVKRHAESFDRVFVDAPCTGTGTWRRNPDAKWRLRPEDLAELTALQAGILDSAQRLTKPGGRLIYVTCSLLREENETQIEQFLGRHADFTLLPIAEVWRETIGGEPPAAGDMLRLSPSRHGTDGFFVAVMARKAKPKPARKRKPQQQPEPDQAPENEVSDA